MDKLIDRILELLTVDLLVYLVVAVGALVFGMFLSVVLTQWAKGFFPKEHTLWRRNSLRALGFINGFVPTFVIWARFNGDIDIAALAGLVAGVAAPTMFAYTVKKLKTKGYTAEAEALHNMEKTQMFEAPRTMMGAVRKAHGNDA